MSKNNTKLGKLPKDWSISTVKELSLIGPQNGLYKSKDHYGSGWEMVHMAENFAYDCIQNGHMKKVELTPKEKTTYELKAGDLLFGRRSLALDGVGKTSIIGHINEPITFESSILRVRLDVSQIKPAFAHAYFTSSYGRAQMMTFARQVAVSGISSNDLKSYQLPLPPLLEQEKIAEILTTWDKAIEKTEELITAKEKKYSGLTQKLINKSNGKDKVLFGEIFQNKKEVNKDVEQLEVLSVTKQGIVKQSEYFKKDVASENKASYLVVDKGDLVLSGLNFWMGSVDFLSICDKGIVSPAYKVFQLKSDKASKEYMKHFVRSSSMIRILSKASVQGASIVRRSLDMNELNSSIIYLPELEEQEKIGNMLNIIKEEIRLTRLYLDKLKAQKQGLMQKLLTGKCRVKTEEVSA